MEDRRYPLDYSSSQYQNSSWPRSEKRSAGDERQQAPQSSGTGFMLYEAPPLDLPQNYNSRWDIRPDNTYGRNGPGTGNVPPLMDGYSPQGLQQPNLQWEEREPRSRNYTPPRNRNPDDGCWRNDLDAGHVAWSLNGHLPSRLEPEHQGSRRGYRSSARRSASREPLRNDYTLDQRAEYQIKGKGFWRNSQRSETTHDQHPQLSSNRRYEETDRGRSGLPRKPQELAQSIQTQLPQTTLQHSNTSAGIITRFQSSEFTEPEDTNMLDAPAPTEETTAKSTRASFRLFCTRPPPSAIPLSPGLGLDNFDASPLPQYTITWDRPYNRGDPIIDTTPRFSPKKPRWDHYSPSPPPAPRPPGAVTVTLDLSTPEARQRISWAMWKNGLAQQAPTEFEFFKKEDRERKHYAAKKREERAAKWRAEEQRKLDEEKAHEQAKKEEVARKHLDEQVKDQARLRAKQEESQRQLQEERKRKRAEKEEKVRKLQEERARRLAAKEDKERQEFEKAHPLLHRFRNEMKELKRFEREQIDNPKDAAQRRREIDDKYREIFKADREERLEKGYKVKPYRTYEEIRKEEARKKAAVPISVPSTDLFPQRFVIAPTMAVTPKSSVRTFSTQLDRTVSAPSIPTLPQGVNPTPTRESSPPLERTSKKRKLDGKVKEKPKKDKKRRKVDEVESVKEKRRKEKKVKKAKKRESEQERAVIANDAPEIQAIAAPNPEKMKKRREKKWQSVAEQEPGQSVPVDDAPKMLAPKAEKAKKKRCEDRQRFATKEHIEKNETRERVQERYLLVQDAPETPVHNVEKAKKYREERLRTETTEQIEDEQLHICPQRKNREVHLVEKQPLIEAVERERELYLYELVPSKADRLFIMDQMERKNPNGFQKACFTERPIVQAGYVFVKRGNSFITSRAKKYTLYAKKVVYTVRNGRSTSAYTGIQIPADIFERVLQSEESSRDERQRYATNRTRGGEPSRVAAMVLDGMFKDLPPHMNEIIISRFYTVQHNLIRMELSLPEKLRQTIVTQLKEGFDLEGEAEKIRIMMKTFTGTGAKEKNEKLNKEALRQAEAIREKFCRKKWAEWGAEAGTTHTTPLTFARTETYVRLARSRGKARDALSANEDHHMEPHEPSRSLSREIENKYGRPLDSSDGENIRFAEADETMADYDNSDDQDPGSDLAGFVISDDDASDPSSASSSDEDQGFIQRRHLQRNFRRSVATYNLSSSSDSSSASSSDPSSSSSDSDSDSGSDSNPPARTPYQPRRIIQSVSSSASTSSSSDEYNSDVSRTRSPNRRALQALSLRKKKPKVKKSIIKSEEKEDDDDVQMMDYPEDDDIAYAPDDEEEVKNEPEIKEEVDASEGEARPQRRIGVR